MIPPWSTEDIQESFTVFKQAEPAEPGPPDVGAFNSKDGGEFVPAKRSLPFHHAPDSAKVVTNPGDDMAWTPYGWVERVQSRQVHHAHLPLADK